MGRRGLIATIVTAVLIVAGANLAVSAIFGRTTANRGYETIEAKWDLMAEQTEPVDWLLVGDSSCNQGLDPRVFAERGVTALNLCTTGDMLVVGDVWLVEEYLREVGPPRNGILVSHVYDVWARDAESLEATAWVIPGGDGWRRNRSLLEASLHERLMAQIGDLIPLYTQPASTIRLMTDPAAVLDAPAPQLTGDGFERAGEARPAQVRGDAAGHRASITTTDAAPSRLNRLAMSKLAELTDEAGVPLVVAPSPLYEELWPDPAFQRRFHQTSDFVDAVADDHPSVVPLRADPWLYPAEEMQNADHLAVAAASRHTGVVIDALDAVGLLDGSPG
jgi:hypothetical protein